MKVLLFERDCARFARPHPYDFLFHAGTSKIKDGIFATGGRVLNFVSLSDNFFQSRENIQKHLKELNWLGGFFRKDIGFKVIEK